jgi:hypothetical protein
LAQILINGCVVIAIISIIALVVIFVLKNKPKSNRNETKGKQLSEMDPRFGAIDSKTEITLNVSEISNAFNTSNNSQKSEAFDPTGADIRKPIPIKEQLNLKSKKLFFFIFY